MNNYLVEKLSVKLFRKFYSALAADFFFFSNQTISRQNPASEVPKCSDIHVEADNIASGEDAHKNLNEDDSKSSTAALDTAGDKNHLLR